MEQWLAIIKDGFRESRDQVFFWIMIGLSLLVALTLFCIGFDDKGVSLFFGKWTLSWHELGVREFAGVSMREMQYRYKVDTVIAVTNLVFGTGGILLALIATANFIPNFLERGTINTVLAKPLSRRSLFMAKYLGGLIFVFIQAAIFVGLIFLVVGVRWKVWMFGFLMCIPLFVLLFSYLYCISAYVAVKSKSAIAAVLVTLVVWMAIAGIHNLHNSIQLLPSLQKSKLLTVSVETTHWIVPKTRDVASLAKKWCGGGMMINPEELPDPEMRDLIARAQNIEQEELNKSVFASIGSSVAFEVVILALAAWSFSRKDY